MAFGNVMVIRDADIQVGEKKISPFPLVLSCLVANDGCGVF
jgi:hypothetical protein